MEQIASKIQKLSERVANLFRVEPRGMVGTLTQNWCKGKSHVHCSAVVSRCMAALGCPMFPPRGKLLALHQVPVKTKQVYCWNWT